MSQAMSENPAPTPTRLLTPAEAIEILVDVNTLNAWGMRKIELLYVYLYVYMYIGRTVRCQPEDVAVQIFRNTMLPNKLKIFRIGG